LSGKGLSAIDGSDAEARTQNKIKVLDSAETRLVMDKFPGFSLSRLYMESLLRKTLVVPFYHSPDKARFLFRGPLKLEGLPLHSFDPWPKVLQFF